MDLSQAQKEVARIFPGQEIELETSNGIRRVVRAMDPDENPLNTTSKPLPAGANFLKDGRVCLGAGPSWLAAIRAAAKPVINKLRAQEVADRAEVQKEKHEFEEFLRETLMPQFEAWKKTKAAPTAQVSP